MNGSAEAVAEAFVGAINRQDVDAMMALMAEEHRFVDSLGRVVQGREAMRTGWKSYFAMVPDYTIAVEERFVDGEAVVVLGRAQGTYAAGVGSAAENRWETPLAIRAGVRSGQVAEWRVYADNEPLRQLMAREAERE